MPSFIIKIQYISIVNYLEEKIASTFSNPCIFSKCCFLRCSSFFLRLLMGRLKLGYMIAWVLELIMMLLGFGAPQWHIVRMEPGKYLPFPLPPPLSTLRMLVALEAPNTCFSMSKTDLSASKCLIALGALESSLASIK